MCSIAKEMNSLLAYEVSQSRRHLRYLSLVMLRLNEAGPKLASLLRGGVRESDSVFFSDNVGVMLMGQTHKTDAIKAMKRFRDEFCDCFDVRSAVSSFPDDGKGPKELVNVLQRRLKNAMELDHGAIVVQ